MKSIPNLYESGLPLLLQETEANNWIHTKRKASLNFLPQK